MEREMRNMELLYQRAFRQCAGTSGEIESAKFVEVLRELGVDVTQRIAQKVLEQVICFMPSTRCALSSDKDVCYDFLQHLHYCHMLPPLRLRAANS